MNFSQTCSLLSQYLKEKGSFGDLNLGMKRASASSSSRLDGNGGGIVEKQAMATKTMDLFPQQSGSVLKEQRLNPNKSESGAIKSEPETSQMTIFYGGQVIVFNDFPADKAKELMLLAASGTSAVPPAPMVQGHETIEPTANANVTSTFSNNMIQDRPQRPPTKPIATDFPIARKASLTRFLEKRKDRITARAPYPTPLADNKSWLGLAAAQAPAHLGPQ